jgi:hypothetical protein
VLAREVTTPRSARACASVRIDVGPARTVEGAPSPRAPFVVTVSGATGGEFAPQKQAAAVTDLEAALADAKGKKRRRT